MMIKRIGISVMPFVVRLVKGEIWKGHREGKSLLTSLSCYSGYKF